MTIIVEINGEEVSSPADLHRALASKLDFGPYYSPNLAALWDRLSTDVERPVDLIWRNWESSRDAMGVSVFNQFRDLLLRVQEYDVKLGFEERFTVRFE